MLPQKLQSLLEWTTKGFVHIKDKEQVSKKLQELFHQSSQKLHIISDFDMTLTKYWVNGVRSPSSHGILHRSLLFPEWAKNEQDALYDKYYPMEIDGQLEHDLKFKAMEEWWTKAHDVIMRARLSKETIRKMVDEVPLTFRDGVDTFFKLCETKDVPVLVFSAGLGDFLQVILEKHSLLNRDVSIVSNMMRFDADGVVEAFEDPLIHVLNKNEASVSSTVHAEKIDGRDNLILMGDSLGDLHMSADVKYHTQLSIGFLNIDEDKSLEKYMDHYDIVLTQDVGLDFINTLLEAIPEYPII
ncbi:pyrimidine 5'-nucleotidase [Gorgonomyces haynaldii]|nr:pyrimidine 5'-nucleotidase [Gorgonomyces haynaldii]